MHFLQITDHDAPFLAAVLDTAIELRDELKKTGRNRPLLERKTLAMIFEKPSLRTRVSFEAGMNQLGGSAINLQPAEIGLNTREPAKDAARVIGGMCDAIMARVFAHDTVEDLARQVVSLLTDDARREGMGERARALVERNRGGVRETVRALAGLVG